MTSNAISEPAQTTENRILLAAEHEFLTKGFAGARTTSIAEAAGVTHAMFHYYFRTKEKLFDRIIADKMEMLRNIMLRSFENMQLPLAEIIRNLINLHLEFISSNPSLPRFLVCEVFNNPERLEILLQKVAGVAPDVLAKLQSKIDDLALRGDCRRVDARMLMLDIVSLNVFPYLAAPLADRMLGHRSTDREAFLQARKENNFNTIMQKLKP